MKTLVIVSHPNISGSMIYKRYIDELNEHAEKYVVYQLCKVYPEERIDVACEQIMIESFDKVIFLFPFYRFDAPSLLKKWFNEVMAHGWAFGSNSEYRCSEKKMALAITVDSDVEREFSLVGDHNYTFKELATSFELIFRYIKADYKGFSTFLGTDLNTSPKWIEKDLRKFINFIETVFID